MTLPPVLAATALMAAAAAGAFAQQVSAPVEHLPFDAPEGWALQYFTSATFMTGLDVDTPDSPGGITVQLEGGWVPSLSTQEEEVGFAGTAREDLNKAPLYVRPRVRFTLPARLALIVAGVPPVHAFGVTPRLASLALEWTMIDTGRWRFAWRAHGETGTVTGAFTCPSSVLASPPGTPGNPTSCVATSADVVTMRYGSIEFEAARRLTRRVTPHLSVAMNAIDSHFQVRAHTVGTIDETQLYASGLTWSIAGGASLLLTRRLAFVADVFYTPLIVQRQTGAPRTNDGLLNVRGLISYRIR